MGERVFIGLAFVGIAAAVIALSQGVFTVASWLQERKSERVSNYFLLLLLLTAFFCIGYFTGP